jgi:hypothetical protein
VSWLQRVQVAIVSGTFVFEGADGFAVAVIALVLLAEVAMRRSKPAATRELRYDEPAQQRDRGEIFIYILNYFRVKGLNLNIRCVVIVSEIKSVASSDSGPKGRKRFGWAGRCFCRRERDKGLMRRHGHGSAT